MGLLSRVKPKANVELLFSDLVDLLLFFYIFILCWVSVLEKLVVWIKIDALTVVTTC